MRKHIAIDITSSQDQFAHRGVGNYTRAVVSELIQNTNYAWDLIGFGSLEDLRQNIPVIKSLEQNGSSNIAFYSLGPVKPTSPLNLWLWWRRFLPILNRIRPDIYFSPEMQRGLPVGKFKTVVMLHDVIPVVQNAYSATPGPINFLKGYFYRHQLAKAKLADLVITNSNFSASEIKRVLGEIAVKTIYLGVGKYPHSNQLPSRLSLEKGKYFYCNSGFEQNKNLELLIDSFADFADTNKEVKLAIVGNGVRMLSDGKFIATTRSGQRVMNHLRRLIESGKDLEGRIVFTGYLSDTEMGAVMQNALALVNLSSYEGFGFSVAEALLQGVPTIAANASCYPEITQGASLLVALEKSQIVSSMQNIATNAKLRSDLAKRGPKVAAQYSWKKCGSETLAAIESLL